MHAIFRTEALWFSPFNWLTRGWFWGMVSLAQSTSAHPVSSVFHHLYAMQQDPDDVASRSTPSPLCFAQSILIWRLFCLNKSLYSMKPGFVQHSLTHGTKINTTSTQSLYLSSDVRGAIGSAPPSLLFIFEYFCWFIEWSLAVVVAVTRIYFKLIDFITINLFVYKSVSIFCSAR